MNDYSKYLEKSKDMIMEFAPKVLMSLAILVIGILIINALMRAIKKLMNTRSVDITLQRFLTNILEWTLKGLLLIMVVSKLGIDTTVFATLIGALGLAAGLSLQGSLSNFAGGILLMIFKPFKIGDFIEAHGVKGHVKEVQIFTTHLITLDNKLAILPNGQLSNGDIMNYTAEGKLRVDLIFGVSYDADIRQTKEVLMNVLTSHKDVLLDPAPSVNVNELADSSVNFAARPWVKPENYWKVYFDITENTKYALDKAGIEIPYPHAVEIRK